MAPINSILMGYSCCRSLRLGRSRMLPETRWKPRRNHRIQDHKSRSIFLVIGAVTKAFFTSFQLAQRRCGSDIVEDVSKATSCIDLDHASLADCYAVDLAASALSNLLHQWGNPLSLAMDAPKRLYGER